MTSGIPYDELVAEFPAIALSGCWTVWPSTTVRELIGRWRADAPASPWSFEDLSELEDGPDGSVGQEIGWLIQHEAGVVSILELNTSVLADIALICALSPDTRMTVNFVWNEAIALRRVTVAQSGVSRSVDLDDDDAWSQLVNESQLLSQRLSGVARLRHQNRPVGAGLAIVGALGGPSLSPTVLRKRWPTVVLPTTVPRPVEAKAEISVSEDLPRAEKDSDLTAALEAAPESRRYAARASALDRVLSITGTPADETTAISHALAAIADGRRPGITARLRESLEAASAEVRAISGVGRLDEGNPQWRRFQALQAVRALIINPPPAIPYVEWRHMQLASGQLWPVVREMTLQILVDGGGR